MRWDDVKQLSRLLPITLVLTLLSGGFVAITVFLPSCVRDDQQSASTRWGEITQHGHALTPITVVNFRGDITLVGTSMQKPIELAIENMERISCGLVKMSVVWDFDITKDMVRSTLRGDSLIIAITSEEVISVFGHKDGESTLGFAHRDGERLKWVFLVVDKRVDDEELSEWTATHELTQAIGMGHVRLGLMEPNAPMFILGKPQWERDDIREFCRIFDCQIDMFDTCNQR